MKLKYYFICYGGILKIKNGVIKNPPPTPNKPVNILIYRLFELDHRQVYFHLQNTAYYILDHVTDYNLNMSKKCELTGKSPLKGHKVSHANNKIKRKFFPNLKKVTFKSEILRRNIKLHVSNAALRTVDYKGGLDNFLKTVKTHKLSKKAKGLKNQIITKA